MLSLFVVEFSEVCNNLLLNSDVHIIGYLAHEIELAQESTGNALNFDSSAVEKHQCYCSCTTHCIEQNYFLLLSGAFHRMTEHDRL